MRALRVQRDVAQPADLASRVICQDLRDGNGRVVVAKGRVLDEQDARVAMELQWSELHLLALDGDDVHEDAAGNRIARAVAGSGVEVRPPSGGHWALAASHRGLLGVDVARLEAINSLDGPCVYSLLDEQVVETGEVVARAKVIPFAVPARVLDDVVAVVDDASDGVIRVRPFISHRIGAVVHESLGQRAVDRFRVAVSEKVTWFGSSLCALDVTPHRTEAIGAALESIARQGAEVVLVAGAKAMDTLDPTFAALQQLGAMMVGHGVPAHPGSLLWLADWKGIPIVGMPTCGLFAQATVFDLVIARLMTGERLGRRDLAKLGHGGFLTRAMAFRLPAYRTATERGAVE